MQVEIHEILKKYKVSDFFDVRLQRQEKIRQVRAYGDRAAYTESTVRYQIDVTRKDEAIVAAKRRIGWRLYASNAPAERLSLAQAVLSYRDQYLVEHDFARLQGRYLGITPLFVQRDDHALGLVRLLTLGLRAMVMEGVNSPFGLPSRSAISQIGCL